MDKSLIIPKERPSYIPLNVDSKKVEDNLRQARFPHFADLESSLIPDRIFCLKDTCKCGSNLMMESIGPHTSTFCKNGCYEVHTVILFVCYEHTTTFCDMNFCFHTKFGSVKKGILALPKKCKMISHKFVL
jgi:hypothetical protein